MSNANNGKRYEDTFRKIVSAVAKGIGRDMRDYYLETAGEETHNAGRMARSDKINTNLRNIVISDGVELIAFKRAAWEGRIIVDRLNKITVTVMSRKTFLAIRKNKDRTFPHYLMTLVHEENSDIEPKFIPVSLFETAFNRFDKDEYRKDYAEIFQGSVDAKDGYQHWVILYDASGFTVNDIEAVLLDRNWIAAQQYSLKEYLVPDFRDLTAESNENENVAGDVHTLVQVKTKIDERAELTPKIRIVKAKLQKKEEAGIILSHL